MFSFVVILSVAFAKADNFTVVPDPHLTAFRSLGVLIDGVAHAHLALSFNLTQERSVLTELKEEITSVTRNTSTKLWAPTLHRIGPLEENWEDFLSLLHAPSPRRERRQALVAAGVLGGAIVASAGLSMWNAHETKILQGRMTRMDGEIDDLFTLVHSSVKLERSLIAHVSTLKKAVIAIENTVDGLEEFMRVSDAAHALFHRLNRRLQGFERVLAHQLSPKLVEEAELRHYFQQMAARIEDAGFAFVFEGVNQMFEEEVTYSLNDDLLTLFIHVPVTARDSRRMELFEHLPLPIVSGNGSTPSLVHAPGSSAFLASDVGKELFIELTPEDLQACGRKGHDYVCSFVFPRLRGGETACLPALFLHHTSSASRWCEGRELKETERIFRINSTAFLIWSEEPATLNFDCNRQLVAQQVQGLVMVNLETGCEMSAEHFTFRAQKGRLPDDLHLVLAAPSIDNVLEAMRDNSTLVDNELLLDDDDLRIQGEELEAEVEEAESGREISRESTSHSVMTILSIMFNILVLFVGISFCARCCLAMAERGQLREARREHEMGPVKTECREESDPKSEVKCKEDENKSLSPRRKDDIVIRLID